MRNYLLLALIFISCNQDKDIELIQAVEPTITEEQIVQLKGSKSQQFNSKDLLDFLAVYGEKVPDITPAFMNYYQDISSAQTNSLFDNLTEPTLDCSYKWYINDKLVSTDQNIVLNPLVNVLHCEGLLEFVDLTEWCECGGCPDYWDVFYEFYPPHDPYFYQTQHSRWDFDKNNFINSEDLLTFLSLYGDQS